MNFWGYFVIRILLVSLFVLSLTSCGFPGYSLNGLEKQADVEWLYGVFERNYAPADWKKAKWGVSMAESKAACLKGAETLANGDEFIAHLTRCVAGFKDAHTHLQAGGQILPETAMVAYLGFTSQLVRVDVNNFDDCKDKDGKLKDTPACKDRNIEPGKKEPRIVYALRVKKLLPTTKPAGFPLAEGDSIVAIDGHAVDEYLGTNLLAGADLGSTPASLNVLAELFPLRASYATQMPTEDSVRFTVLKSPKTIDVELPWSRTDYAEFMRHLAEVTPKAPDATPKKNSTGAFWVGEGLIDDFFHFASEYRNGAGNRVQLILDSTFKVFRFHPALSYVEQMMAAPAEVKKEEPLPFDTAAPGPVVDISKGAFKARVVLLEDGGRVGYIRIDTFSLSDEADVKTFQELLKALSKMKVKGIIFDTLDNGGGSLVAGLRMANALTTKELKYPAMQLGLNDNWVNGFRGDSFGAPTDAGRTRAARISRLLKEDIAKGLRISRPISATELDVFELTGDKANCLVQGKCVDPSIKLVLLTNEMCASMCDIFASVFRDNQLGTIIGSQTMGAGGNVVMHGIAPVTQVMVSQTESLIVDVNGEYLENQGVKPDIEVDTIFERAKKYSGVYAKAFASLK
jgi:hypothetical protein